MQKTVIPGIYKVEEGVLINNDLNALQQYKKRKKLSRKSIDLEEKVNKLESQLEEIKNLLQKLVK